jgi:tellurite methyltransferase
MTGEDRKNDWAAYYEATAGRSPRRTLLLALDLFGAAASGRRAVDLGCGGGRDAIELLRRGWSVIAVDAEPAALAYLEARPDLPSGAKLVTMCEKFETATWPESDLVNASFALPLCPPASFPALWSKITASLVSGGRFAGQLYGDRDGWAANPDMTVLDQAAAHGLFADYSLELFDEEESDAVTPRGKPKHWHIFHIVACKR